MAGRATAMLFNSSHDGQHTFQKGLICLKEHFQRLKVPRQFEHAWAASHEPLVNRHVTVEEFKGQLTNATLRSIVDSYDAKYVRSSAVDIFFGRR